MLFGIKSAAADTTKISALASELKDRKDALTVVESKSSGATAASRGQAGRSDGIPEITSGEQYYAMKAKAEAQKAEYLAGEAAFKAENGFSRRVTPSLESTHRFAMSGDFSWSVPDRREAMAIAGSEVNKMLQNTRVINSYESVLTDEAYNRYVEVEGKEAADIGFAKMKDSIKAEKLLLDISVAIFNGTFDTSQPLFSVDESGKYQMTEQVVEFQGQSLIGIKADNYASKFDRSGVEYESTNGRSTAIIDQLA